MPLWLFVLALTVAACAPTAPNARTQAGEQSAPSKQGSKTIAIAVNEDVSSIWDAVTSGGGTVSVSWSEPYPFADRLEHRELFPLPRHLLERSYNDARDSFLLQSYFSDDFVGLGPYRVTRWERGSHLDLAAFDEFFLGRPKIDTIRILFVTDTNTMLANLKSHTAQMMLTLGSAPKFDALMSLKHDWEATGHGTVLTDPIAYSFIEPQKRKLASPPDLADPRVRQAMMYAIDREALMQVH